MISIDPQLLCRCWFLAGPTASGKTAVSLLLAERLGGEILGMDSMTLYRGMDIGTAKPSRAERQHIPHHLFDLLEPREEFSVARYLAEAEDAVRQVFERGKVPIFVGGTGLYLRSLLRGVFSGPSADPQVRAELEEIARVEGAAGLHRRLREVDPESADRLHENDQRRVLRALEVYQLTGQPLSAQQQQPPRSEAERPRHVYWISPPRDWLHSRINRRVVDMCAQGLVEEARRIWEGNPPPGRTARQALGYKELFDVFEGRGTLDQAVETIQTRTRQFAKRQCTWFRNLEECQPVAASGEETPATLVEGLLRKAGDQG